MDHQKTSVSRWRWNIILTVRMHLFTNLVWKLHTFVISEHVGLTQLRTSSTLKLDLLVTGITPIWLPRFSSGSRATWTSISETIRGRAIKVGCIWRGLIQGARSTKKFSEKVRTFFIIENFVGLFLNLYGRSMVAIWLDFANLLEKLF